MDEKAKAALYGLIAQLRLEHPFETEKQIMKRYGERLVADPELMADAMRGAFELARHLDPDHEGEEAPSGLGKPH
jgi:hypothetical protein